jgi:hypothetical protein
MNEHCLFGWHMKGNVLMALAPSDIRTWGS